MPRTFTNRSKYSQPTAGDCNWDYDWYRNERIKDAINNSLLDNNFVKSGLSLTDGGLLTVDLVGGVAQVAGTDFTIASGSINVIAATVEGEFQYNFIYIDDAGAVQVTQTEPTETGALIAVVDTNLTGVEQIADLRRFEPGTSEADIDAKVATVERKNYLINGSFKITQRQSRTVQVTASGNHISDRWKALWNGGAFSSYNGYNAIFTQGFSQAIKATSVFSETAGNFLVPFMYAFEGQDILVLNSKNMVLSFEMYATVAGTYCVAVRSGAGARSFVVEFEYDTATIMQKIEVVIPFDSTASNTQDSTVGVTLGIATHSGSTYHHPSPGSWTSGNYLSTANADNWASTVNNLVIISGVQLEVGNTATIFEERPYAEELALCQRYYQKHVGDRYIGRQHLPSTSSVQAIVIDFPVEMRANPTVVRPTLTEDGCTYSGQILRVNGYVLTVTTDSSTAYRIYSAGGQFFTFNSEI